MARGQGLVGVVYLCSEGAAEEHPKWSGGRA